MAGSKKKLTEIHIKLHHTAKGENDGFSTMHSYDGADGSYARPEDGGTFRHHGSLMEHLHEHVKDHGSQQAELEAGQQSADGESAEHTEGCVLCSDPQGEGEKETRKAKMTNVAGHGFEKNTPNAYGKTGRGDGANLKKAHPGFKNVQHQIMGKEHLGAKAAGAILASRTRGASAGAKKANPRLNRVNG